MKKLMIFILIIAVFSSIYAFDELWQKTQQIAANSNNLVPGKSTTKFGYKQTIRLTDFMIDWEVVIAHSLGEDGGIKNTLVSRNLSDNYNELRNNSAITRSDLRDFKDIIDDMKASFGTMTDELIKQETKTQQLSMFSETDPKKMIVKRQKRTQVIDGKSCILYKIDYRPSKDKDEHAKGDIWIDSVTGAPVLAEVTANMKLMGQNPKATVYFHYDEAKNQFYPIRQEADFSMNIQAMNMRVTISTVSELEDYWEMPAK